MKKLFTAFLLSVLIWTMAFSRDNENKHISNTGYQNYTSFGLLPGSTENEKDMPFSLGMDNNYTFSGHFSAGITSGIEFLHETIIPVAVNMKVLFPFEYKTFYAGGYYGKTFPLNDPEYLLTTNYYHYIEDIKAHGGVITGGEIGVIFPFAPGSEFFMAVGYRYNELKYRYTDHRGNVSTTVYYNRLNVKLGIVLF